MIYYESSIYGSPWRQECASLEEAAGCALSDMETGEAWPRRILDEDAVLWEQSGPLTTGGSLKAFYDELKRS